MKKIKKLIWLVAAVSATVLCSGMLTSCDPEDALDYMEDMFDY